MTDPVAPGAPAAAGGIAGRLPAGAIGIAAGLVAGALAGLTVAGVGALAAGLFAVQVVVALAWVAALDVRGGGGAFVILVLTSGVVDGVVAGDRTPDIGQGAGVIGAMVSLALLFQLARRPRVEVTVSFAGIVSGGALALAAASYAALAVESGGDRAVVCALLGCGVALAVGRVADLALPRPAVPGSRRGIVGLVLGLGSAALVGWAAGSRSSVLTADAAARLAVITALVAVLADLAIDAALLASPGLDERARSAIPPLGILLPVVVAGPAAYVAGRILLG
ncbi:MAG: hypothetical protein JO222_07365 [Frankiales bacterium]|nr:hypothetical protein [Frankiales bacterium]